MNSHLLFVYLLPFKKRLGLLLGLLLGSIGLKLYGPQLLRRFLDMAQGGSAVQLLVQTAVLFLLVVVGQKAVNLLTVYFSEDLGWAATNRLRVDLASHCLRLDMGFHKARTPGELIARIDGDVSTLAEAFSRLVIEIVGNGLLILGVLLLIFREDWRVGLVGITYGSLNLLAIRALQQPVVKIWGDVRQGFAELSGYLEERMGGTEDIRANGGEAYVVARLYPLMARVNNGRTRAALLGGLSFSTSYILYVLAWVATLGLAAGGYLRGELTIGTVFLVAFYIALLESPLTGIRHQMEDLQRAMASTGRINEFLQLRPSVVEKVVAKLPDGATAVHFNHVSFTYQDEVLQVGESAGAVLTDVNLTLPAGRVLGLLGRTGSGKTTLTRLLFRLYDVGTGQITLDGINVGDVALADLRQHVGMVTQEVQLFAATIRDNLTLFHNYSPDEPPIDDGRLLTALETLGLGDWLRSQPNGLDTLLKSSGQGLSAGEAQLLAFTRLFLRDPKLIILDEASSRLDPATEQLLERAIDRLLAGRTAIIIAHRLRTVQRADDILILENGRVIEHGPRLALAANANSRFAALLQTGLEEVLI